LSNTNLLEHMGWNGILAEPARHWQENLKASRKAAIDSRCVWSKTGERLQFVETKEKELSTIDSLVDSDFNREARGDIAATYEVETVSLEDLLTAHSAPKTIDYLSIDTEGSEFEILSHFDFKKRDIGIITVEHNFTGNREKIGNLLRGNGFFNVFGELSKWDDWYLNQAFFAR
jgi:FkbM family methyltransferase